MSRWYVEGYWEKDGQLKQQVLNLFPQVLGRDETLSCAISSPFISRRHARISEHDGRLMIEDLSSSNGTFVNHQRIDGPTPVKHGDVIHLGSIEIRLIDADHATDNHNKSPSQQNTLLAPAALSKSFPLGVSALEELIETGAVESLYQPILRATDMSVCGYEALGRGKHEGLANDPGTLFSIAESFGLAARLSSLMRSRAVETAAINDLKGDLLLNTHPEEMDDLDAVLASLQQTAKSYPSTQMVLEIHEQAIADIDALKALRRELKAMSVKLAFDDFGVGQSRLLELVVAKPDIVKFDRALIEGIESSDSSRLTLLESLTEMTAELSIDTLAECVSTQGQYEACQRIGFDLYQGFYFARPESPERVQRVT